MVQAIHHTGLGVPIGASDIVIVMGYSANFHNCMVTRIILLQILYRNTWDEIYWPADYPHLCGIQYGMLDWLLKCRSQFFHMAVKNVALTLPPATTEET